MIFFTLLSAKFVLTETFLYNSGLLCLILQVESLTAARKSSMNGVEPSDAIRVVNAILTQLDQIRRLVPVACFCLHLVMASCLCGEMCCPSTAAATQHNLALSKPRVHLLNKL